MRYTPRDPAGEGIAGPTIWANTQYLPRNVWEVDSWLENRPDVDAIKSEMGDILQHTLQRPAHPGINFNTRSNNGSFESVVQAMNLIMAGERQFLLFVTGSRWSEYVNYMPMFGVVGGVIRLEKQQWDIDLQLQPYGHRNGLYDQAKWSTIPYTMDWGDAKDSGVTDGLERGVTWYDTRFIEEPQTIRTWSDDN